MPFITTDDGTDLFYSDWGKGDQVVVFVHAWGLSSKQWQYQLRDFIAQGFRCITYDKRGHGRSDQSGGGYDHDTLADDLATLIQTLDLQGVNLIGHSFGCGQVVRYVTRHGRDRVDRAVLLAPCLPLLLKTPDNEDGWDLTLVDANVDLLAQDVPKWCEVTAPSYFGSAPHDLAGLVDWTCREIIDTPLPVLLETLRSNACSDFRSELPGFDVPTLILHGDADTSAPIQLTSQKTAPLLPECTFITYPEAGHGFYASEHPQVNRDILAFLAKT